MEAVLILGNGIRLKAQLEESKAFAVFNEFARQISGEPVAKMAKVSSEPMPEPPEVSGEPVLEPPKVFEAVIPQSLKKPKEKGRVTKDELIALYIDENKTARDCADYFGVDVKGITSYLAQHGIRKNSKDI